MGTVTNLIATKSIEEFIDFLFGVEVGFVYIPTKDPDSTTWFESWFEWPKQRQGAVNHVSTLSKTREVYIAPVIYSEPTLNAGFINGSSVVWCEFDGKVPSHKLLTEKNSPPPTVRVRSSKNGHEHWYWKLDKFSTDLKALQDINKELAYGLGADPSGWDIEQVLRPVGSLNHKRNTLPVVMISNSMKYHSLSDFTKLPPVEVFYSEEDFNAHAIPNADNVLLKYAWASSEIELIRSSAREGQRSSMLTKLGYICCEKGLDNSEVYSVLEFADSRWLKFYNRKNRKQCYIKLIDYVRQKHPFTTEIKEAELPVEEEKFKYILQGFVDHFNETEHVEWIIPGLLHNSSSFYLVGMPGSLKTALAMELGMELSLGRSILNWENTMQREFKLAMWSLEMSGPEVTERQKIYMERYNEEELAILNKNFQIYSKPDPVRLFNPVEALAFKEAILDTKPDGIIIDSASMAYSPDMSSEDEVKKSVRFLQGLRHQHNFFQITVHHPRKDPAGVKNQKMTLSDLFGSQIMSGSATTVLGMVKRDKKENESQKIDLIHLKTRFSEVPADYTIELVKETFSFRRPVIAVGNPNDNVDDMLGLSAEADRLKPKKSKPGDINGPSISF